MQAMQWVASTLKSAPKRERARRDPHPADPAIEIEEGIPIPPRRRLSASHRKFPFMEMAVGDSIFQRGVDGHRLERAMRQHMKHHPARFVARQMDDGIRVWRVE